MQKSNKLFLLIPIVSGIICFFVICGFNALNPSNLAVVADGDPACEYIGWQHFRKSPLTLPPGSIPTLGIGLENSIALSGSMTLTALLFKPFASVLPQNFQYAGIWLLTCFILQAIVAWKLAGLWDEKILFRFFCMCLMLFAPPWLWRLHGHYMLFGHFLILAALYLYFKSWAKPRKYMLLWCILMCISVLAHIYICAMCTGIFIASLIDGIRSKRINIKDTVISLFASIAGILLLLWLVGYFSGIPMESRPGFGFYRMNILSFLNPDGWSYILKNIPSSPGEYEGFNYLGLGLLLIMIWCIPYILSPKYSLWNIIKNNWPLFVVLVLLFIYALSNNIYCGKYEVFTLPQKIYPFSDSFRAGGRFFWPIYYVLVLFCCITIIKFFKYRTGIILLAIATVVQAADTSTVWSKFSNLGSKSSIYKDVLCDEFWDLAAKKYKNIVGLPFVNADMENKWKIFGSFCGDKNLSTDMVYMPAIKVGKNEQKKIEYENIIKTGKLNNDTLYIVDDKTWKFLKYKLKDNTLFKRIDGFNVIAPDWKKDKLIMENNLFGDEYYIDFSKNDSLNLPIFIYGLSAVEHWGRWSDGEKITFMFPYLPQEFDLYLKASPFGPNTNMDYKVIIGKEVYKFNLTHSDEKILRILNPDLASSIIIEIPHPISPKELGINDDTRKIGIGLKEMKIRPISDKAAH